MRSIILRSIALPAAMALALSAGSSCVASSQATGGSPAARLGVVRGDRVRLVAPNFGNEPQVGTVTAVRGDSIVFRRERQGDSATIGFAHIARLEVSRGRHTRPLAGLGIGFASGAVAGAVIGLASYKKSAFLDFGPGADAGAGALVGGAAGAIIGLVTGAFIHTERWRSVPLNSQTGLNLIPSPTGPRLAVRVAVRF